VTQEINYYYYYYYYICYHLYARYSQLYNQNQPRHYGMQCCSCSVFTVCAACNVISPAKYVLFLHISTSRSLCAMHNMAIFCSSLFSSHPYMLLRYFPSDFEMDSVVPVTMLFYIITIIIIIIIIIIAMSFVGLSYIILKFKHSIIIDFHVSNKETKMDSVF
jgi:hypothetical protein